MCNLKRISTIVAALSAIAVWLSCTGFFVNQPNSISVTQAGTNTLAVQTGSANAVQLTATATYNSGSKDVTNSASWVSSSACATVTPTGGKVTGVGAASGVTITASLGGVSGSISGNVTGASAQTLTITPAGPFTQATTPTVQFTATDSSNNNLTNSATWTSSDTTVLTFSSTSPGFASLLTTGTTTVSASTSSGSSCASGSLQVTVN